MTTNDLDGITCLVSIPDGGRMVSFYTCGRPAKGWGSARFGEKEIPMCGIHLAAERRKADNDAARKAATDLDRLRRIAAEALIDTLPGWLRNHARPEWVPSRHTGKVTITLDALTIERLNSALTRAAIAEADMDDAPPEYEHYAATAWSRGWNAARRAAFGEGTDG